MPNSDNTVAAGREVIKSNVQAAVIAAVLLDTLLKAQGASVDKRAQALTQLGEEATDTILEELAEAL